MISVTTSVEVSAERVLEELLNVKDPEIDSVSIIDLGMVEEVTTDGKNVKIVLLPTFLGCPALEFIKKNTLNAVKGLPGVEEVEVEFVFIHHGHPTVLQKKGMWIYGSLELHRHPVILKRTVHGMWTVPIVDLRMSQWRIFLDRQRAEVFCIVRAVKMSLRQ